MSERITQAPPRVVLLAQRGRFLVGEPFFGRGRSVTVQRTTDARPGRLALLRSAPKGGHFRIERVLGRPDVARDVLEALMLDRGLWRRFPRSVVQAAESATPPELPRRDLTALPTFTIDPVTARDFDDAISCEALGEAHWRVWVHIADVSAYVRPGSPIDREAYRRSTSVYVPGLVEPMLPEALSNDACSLRPAVDRLAVTAELELRGAETVKASFYRSVIRSDERLDYDQVDRIFAGAQEARDPWSAPLAAARQAGAELEQRRAQGHALSIESTEPEFRFDRRGHITASEPTEQTEAHRLIEHLMIAANEAVAKLLVQRGVPALHRVHEKPDPARAERLVAQLASLDVATPAVGEVLSPTQATEVIAGCSQLVDQHVRRTGHGRAALTSLVLRSLKQARYDPQPLGHSGLGLEHYTHFTSPIRRYPDLIAHRALLSAVGGGEDTPRAITLDEAGEWTSGRERDAMVIERDADDVARCFLLERELFEHGWDTVREGEIVGLIGAGAFVEFGAGFEGMLPVRRMPGDWWEVNDEGTILMGTRSGGAIRLGDPVTVAVRSVDAPRGRVDLDLVAIPDAAPNVRRVPS